MKDLHARQSRQARRSSSRSFIPMSTTTTSFITRTFQNPAATKGISAAIAGILVAVVSEALWPTA
jgi:hypothetical protein